MKMLAVDFSSNHRTVALLESSPAGGDLIAETADDSPRADRALHMVNTALAQARLEREEIDAIALGLGPGSYTGIRAAIALAQGWHIAGPIKLTGASSVAALALEAQRRGLRGRVQIVIDAQRNELYRATYRVTDTETAEIEPLRIEPIVTLSNHLQPGDLIIGPEANRWFGQAKILFPQAALVGQLALHKNQWLPPDRLEPIYLRPTAFVKAPPPRPLPPH